MSNAPGLDEAPFRKNMMLRCMQKAQQASSMQLAYYQTYECNATGVEHDDLQRRCERDSYLKP